jgi:hypothetical protein
MKKVGFIIAIIILVFLQLHCEVSFSEYLSIEKMPGRNVGLQFFDYDNDSVEEFFTISNEAEAWVVNCYSSLGDTLFTNTLQNYVEYDYLCNFGLFKSNEENYLVTISSQNAGWPENTFLRLYNLNTYTLLSEELIAINLGSPISLIEDFNVNTIGEDHYVTFYIKSYANIIQTYKIENEQFILIQSNHTKCTSIAYDNFQNLYYSAEYDEEIDNYYGPGGFESHEITTTHLIKSYSTDQMAVVDSLSIISGTNYWDSYDVNWSHDYPVDFKSVLSNISTTQDRNKIVFFRIENGSQNDYSYSGYLKSYNFDFTSEYWNVEFDSVSQAPEISDIRFINPIEVDQNNYLLILRYNNIVELRNEETGALVTSDSYSINPSFYLLSNTGILYYVTEDDYQYTIYSIDISMSHTNNYEIQIKSNLVNYPNPFNPVTKIAFSLPQESKIDLSIYNIKGQKVKTLIEEQLEAGSHAVEWNSEDDTGKPVASGIYFCKLRVNSSTVGVKKMLLLK